MGGKATDRARAAAILDRFRIEAHVCTTPVLILAWLVTAAAAVLQGTVDLGFALVWVPILTLIDPHLTPIPQVLVVSPLTLSMVLRERQHLDLRGGAWVLTGRVPGALAGAALLALVGRRMLDGMIATFVQAAALAMAGGWSVRQTRTNQVIAGIASGIAGPRRDRGAAAGPSDGRDHHQRDHAHPDPADRPG